MWFVNFRLDMIKKVLRSLNQLYLKSTRINQHDFLLADIELKNVKCFMNHSSNGDSILVNEIRVT